MADLPIAGAPPADRPVLDLGPRPGTARSWLRAVAAHRSVLLVLAAKDFKVRYKRATFGVLWAVALPLLQSIVMITVFSRIARFSEEGFDYAGYVLAGMAGWGYVSASVPAAATAIVDAASLTDKVWFPRALLVLSPMLANLIGLVITLTLVSIIELIRNDLGREMVLLVPAVLLLVTLVGGICLTAAALHVTFRDIRFMVVAGLMVLFYATPVLYPLSMLGDLGTVLSVINPLVGAISLFQAAFTGAALSTTALVSSVVWTLVLLVTSVQLHHRRDRLFVDLL